MADARTLSVEVTSTDKDLAREIRSAALEGPKPPSGGFLVGEPAVSRREQLTGFPTADVITFAVTLAASIPVNLFSNWLYDLLRGRASKLRIDGKAVTATAKGIEKAVWKLTQPRQDGM
jgi:hypothetical protein